MVMLTGIEIPISTHLKRPSAACSCGVRMSVTPKLGLLALVGLPILGLGIGSLIKTWWTYKADYFAPLNVSGLLHKVKVSGVRPVPARLRGTIIGKGAPGLIWSDDFVMQDTSGILFLDAGKPVEVVGWFRRSPVPYLELKSLTVDGVTRNCYARHAHYAWAAFLAVVGVGLMAAGFAA